MKTRKIWIIIDGVKMSFVAFNEGLIGYIWSVGPVKKFTQHPTLQRSVSLRKLLGGKNDLFKVR